MVKVYVNENECLKQVDVVGNADWALRELCHNYGLTYDSVKTKDNKVEYYHKNKLQAVIETF